MAHGTDREEAAVWRGIVRAAAAGPTPDEAWALLRDFCSLDRWVSSVETCRKLEGADGRPGCIRYCAGPVNMAAPDEAVGWSKEKLVEIDAAGRSYSYEVVETNKGFGRYRATIGVEHDPAGCAVMWSFEADPVKGWTLEGFVGFLEKLARGVAKRLEEEIMIKAIRFASPRLASGAEIVDAMIISTARCLRPGDPVRCLHCSPLRCPLQDYPATRCYADVSCDGDPHRLLTRPPMPQAGPAVAAPVPSSQCYLRLHQIKLGGALSIPNSGHVCRLFLSANYWRQPAILPLVESLLPLSNPYYQFLAWQEWGGERWPIRPYGGAQSRPSCTVAAGKR